MQLYLPQVTAAATTHGCRKYIAAGLPNSSFDCKFRSEVVAWRLLAAKLPEGRAEERYFRLAALQQQGTGGNKTASLL